ncbi:hypothetical protein EVAR_77738_1 [Eumeta japonica]|uniref:Uncharacterized protein n=1 Tax=Eumeta variegata TaxID=151549 RepID=A0A4C1TAV9_EUMVA|nr:hypothetical protein EVAR_77738_1 [Eumeta japonica]
MFNPSPVQLNFNPGPSFDSNSGPFLNFALCSAFNSNTAPSPSSDLHKARIKFCLAKDNKLRNSRAWRSAYLNGLSSVRAKISVLVDHCYKKKLKCTLNHWDSLSGGARPNVGVGDISFARPFSLPSHKYVYTLVISKYHVNNLRLFARPPQERGRRRSPTPSAATGLANVRTKEAETENISPPAEWNTVVSESGISFEAFVTSDDGVIIAGTLSDDEIVDSVAHKTDTNDLDDTKDSDNTTYTPWVSIKKARTALNMDFHRANQQL